MFYCVLNNNRFKLFLIEHIWVIGAISCQPMVRQVCLIVIITFIQVLKSSKKTAHMCAFLSSNVYCFLKSIQQYVNYFFTQTPYKTMLSWCHDACRERGKIFRLNFVNCIQCEINKTKDFSLTLLAKKEKISLPQYMVSKNLSVIFCKKITTLTCTIPRGV